MSSNHENFLRRPSLVCEKCRSHHTVSGGQILLTKSRDFDVEKFSDFDIFNGSDARKDYAIKVVFQLSNLAKTFENDIKDIYLIDDNDVYDKYKGTLNIVFDIASLNLTRYRHRVISGESNALTLWGSGDTTIPQLKHRIILFLSRINESSKNINIWIWGIARIFHIDFFSALPARDIQIQPKKLYRV
jgi:hypothetical protein